MFSNENQLKIQNYDERFNDISMIPEAWKEGTSQDNNESEQQQSSFTHMNQSNLSNNQNQYQFNTLGQYH